MAESPRRIERERVLTLLYEAEMKDAAVDDIISELPLTPEPFVAETVRGVASQTEALDKAIDGHAIDWSTDRMASIDRAVLRIGAWELINRPELPVAVVISEAIELAKRFSTEESGRFVNGVLAAIAADVRQ